MYAGLQLTIIVILDKFAIYCMLLDGRSLDPKLSETVKICFPPKIPKPQTTEVIGIAISKNKKIKWKKL